MAPCASSDNTRPPSVSAMPITCPTDPSSASIGSRTPSRSASGAATPSTSPTVSNMLPVHSSETTAIGREYSQRRAAALLVARSAQWLPYVTARSALRTGQIPPPL
jgi:hypothetical protein